MLKVGRKYANIKLRINKNTGLSAEELENIAIRLPEKLQKNKKILNLIKDFSTERSIRYINSNLEYSVLNCKRIDKFYFYFKLALTNDYAEYGRQLQDEFNIEQQRLHDIKEERKKIFSQSIEDPEISKLLYNILDYVSENVSGKEYKLWIDETKIYSYSPGTEIIFFANSKQAAKHLSENYRCLFSEALANKLEGFEIKISFVWYNLN